MNRITNKIGSEAFWPTTLDKESDKAARILRSFCSKLQPCFQFCCVLRRRRSGEAGAATKDLKGDAIEDSCTLAQFLSYIMIQTVDC